MDVPDRRREGALAAGRRGLRRDDLAVAHDLQRVADLRVERVRHPDLTLGPEQPRARVARAAEPAGQHQPAIAGKPQRTPQLEVDPVAPDRVGDRPVGLGLGREHQPRKSDRVTADVLCRSARQRGEQANILGIVQREVEPRRHLAHLADRALGQQRAAAAASGRGTGRRTPPRADPARPPPPPAPGWSARAWRTAASRTTRPCRLPEPRSSSRRAARWAGGCTRPRPSDRRSRPGTPRRRCPRRGGSPTAPLAHRPGLPPRPLRHRRPRRAPAGRRSRRSPPFPGSPTAPARPYPRSEPTASSR